MASEFAKNLIDLSPPVFLKRPTIIPSKTKAYFYEKINEMLVRIDRKDIFGLVKEYQEAKRNWNKEDYVRLYEDIKKIYGRLPDKDRKKVHDIINGY